MKKTNALLAALSLVWACGTGTDTVDTPADTSPTGEAAPTTEAMAPQLDATTLAELRDDVADFGSELQANASEELTSAWQRLETELTLLADAVEQGEVDSVDTQPVEDAFSEVATAVDAEMDQLSDEFQQFWTELRSRMETALG